MYHQTTSSRLSSAPPYLPSFTPSSSLAKDVTLTNSQRLTHSNQRFTNAPSNSLHLSPSPPSSSSFTPKFRRSSTSSSIYHLTTPCSPLYHSRIVSLFALTRRSLFPSSTDETDHRAFAIHQSASSFKRSQGRI